MLYVLPIEPLQERYSAQWLKWTENYVRSNGIVGHMIINPTKNAYATIQRGSFLDVVNTNVYKNAQLQIVLELFQQDRIKDGDIFWVHDMWFPGLEMLAYIRDGLGLNIKIYGMLHAGTYDSHDFLAKKGMRKWGKYQESAWFNIVDGIFVATNFHKKLIKKNSTGISAKKIHVTGFPMYANDFVPKWDKNPKDKIIVFPHRLDAEKQPHLFDEFKQEMLEKYPWSREYQFIKTKEVCKTKDEYYQLLRRAEYAVSFAEQETWGIAQIESVLCGCIPIIPNRLSYREMYPSQFKYSQDNKTDDASMAASLIDTLQNHIKPKAIDSVLRQLQNDMRRNGESAFNNMMEIMGVI